MCKRVCLILSILLAQASVVAADDGLAPSIPNAITATATAANSIELTWQSSSDADGIKGYNVYRNGSFVASTANSSFHDQNLSAGTTYEYWVVAEDNSGRFSSTSRWVYERTLTTGDDTVAASAVQTNSPEIFTPNPPEDLEAIFQSSGTVALNWSASATLGTIEGYNIYRNGDYLATTHDSSFVDQTAPVDAGVSYSVVAYTTNKQFSSHSSTVNAQGGTLSPLAQASDLSDPGMPVELTANIESNSSLTLTWASVDNVRGYNVYRDDQYVATVWSESWSDSGLSAGQRYRYSVVAFNGNDQFSQHSDDLAVELSANNDNDPRNDSVENTDENGRSAATNNAIGSDYSLAFSDEFNSSTLDLNKWNTAYLWGPDLTTNNESQYYVDIANQPDFGYQPFSGNGEHLSIQADHTPDWLRDRTNGKPYVSGVMTSYDAFQFTYGYAEARIRAPKGNGFFAAFWLLNARYVDLEPEIDISEFLGENPYVVHHTYHYYDANDTLVSSPTFDTWVDDFSNDFHTYAVRWSPGEIIWYVDGRETRRLAHDQVSQQPMYVLFNLAIDGDWPQSPDSNTVFPSALEIDYVRVYRR